MDDASGQVSAGSGVMHPHGMHRLLHPLWFTPVYTTLAKILAAQPDERVIDVGGGTGALSERLARSGAKVVCLEPDHDSLAAARLQLAGADVEFIEAPVESIPLPDGCIDGAVASVTAHHWADQDAGFAELARILRPGGRLVMAEFQSGGTLRRTLRRLAGSKHVNPPVLADWANKLRAAGFSDVSSVPSGWISGLALFVRAQR